MPIVERLPIGTVKTEALTVAKPNRDVPVDAFGARAGKAMEQAGTQMGALSDRADKTLALIDETSAKDAELTFSRALGDMLHHPETGYYGKRGKAALDAYDETRKGVDQLIQTHAEGLSPGAARSFSIIAGRRMETALSSMDAHRRKETETWAAEASQARVANALAEAETGYTSEEVRDRSLAVGRTEIKDEAERRGQDPELTKLQLRTFESSLHRSVLTRMADSDPAAAQDYYNKNAGTLWGNDTVLAEKTIKAATLFDTVQRESDRIWAQSGGNLQRAHQALGDIKDQTVRQHAWSEIRTRSALAEQAAEQGRRANFKAAYDTIESGKPIPPSLWAALDPHQREAALGYQDKRRRGQKVETDMVYYGQLMLMPLAELRQKDPTEMSMYLALPEYKEVIKRRSRDDNLPDIASVEQQMKATIQQLNLKDDGDRGRVIAALTKALDEKQQALGRPPTYAERQPILDGVFLQVKKVRTLLPDTTIPLGEVRSIDDIPDSEVKALRKIRPTASDDDIVRAYVGALLRRSAPQPARPAQQVAALTPLPPTSPAPLPAQAPSLISSAQAAPSQPPLSPSVSPEEPIPTKSQTAPKRLAEGRVEADAQLAAEHSGSAGKALPKDWGKLTPAEKKSWNEAYNNHLAKLERDHLARQRGPVIALPEGSSLSGGLKVDLGKWREGK